MGFIKEPRDVDFIVAPSSFTEETRKTIIQAIEQYKKTGKKPTSIESGLSEGSYTQITRIKPVQKTIMKSTGRSIKKRS